MRTNPFKINWNSKMPKIKPVSFCSMPKVKVPKFPTMPKLPLSISFNDSDKDGMPNFIDCEPFNPYKQGVKLNKLMQERVNKLPIYVTSKGVSISSNTQRRTVKPVHIADKKAPYQSKQKAYSILKKYPSLISDIERSKSKGVVFTDKGIIDRGKTSKSTGGFADMQQRFAVVSTKNIDKQGLEGTKFAAVATAHELKHIRQTKTPHEKQRRLWTGEYWQQKGEIAARKEGAKVAYERPDVSTKIVERQIENKDRKFVTIRRPETYEKQRISKEMVTKYIEEKKKKQQEDAEAGFRKVTSDEPTNQHSEEYKESQ